MFFFPLILKCSLYVYTLGWFMTAKSTVCLFKRIDYFFEIFDYGQVFHAIFDAYLNFQKYSIISLRSKMLPIYRLSVESSQK